MGNKTDRDLIKVDVKRLTPVLNDMQRVEGNPTLGVGHTVHPDFLVGASAG